MLSNSKKMSALDAHERATRLLEARAATVGTSTVRAVIYVRGRFVED